MLSEENKALILQEEIYREEVRKDLSSQTARTTRFPRLWGFLNSSFGIWFLSTCVIGAATFGFASFLDIQKSNRAKNATIHKLDTEITARLQAFVLTKDKIVPAKSLLLLEVPDKSEFPSNVFPEYKSRTFRSLLYELHGLVADKDKQEIKTALEETANWHFSYFMLNESPGKVTGMSGWIKKVISRETIGSLNLKRWGSPFDKYEE